MCLSAMILIFEEEKAASLFSEAAARLCGYQSSTFVQAEISGAGLLQMFMVPSR